MSIFDGIESAKATQNTAYLKEGTYWVLIQELKEGKSRKNVPFFSAEGDVVRVVDGGSGPTDNHRVGDAVNEFRSSSNDFFHSDVKRTLSAITGEATSAITPDFCDLMVGETQPAKGFVVEYSITTEPQKKDPEKTFTRVTCKRRIEKAELEGKVPDNFVSQLSPYYA